MTDRKKEEKLFDAIADIDSELIEESLSYKKIPKKRKKEFVLGGIAAAAVVMICGGYFYHVNKPKTAENKLLINDAANTETNAVTNKNGDESKNYIDGDDYAPKNNNIQTNPETSIGSGNEMYSNEETGEDINSLVWSGNSIELTKEAVVDERINMVSNNEKGSINVSEDFVAGTADFSVELLKQCMSSEKNVFISPLSAQIVLSMTANGADGRTLAQLEKVLGGTQHIDELNKNINKYTNKLIFGEASRIKFADSIWVKNTMDLKLSDSFLQIAANHYYAQVYSAPFDDSTVNDVNCWVSENTEGKIKKMIEDLSGTGICLINTVFFEAEWETAYRQSVDGTFTNNKGETKNVKVMKSIENHYIEDELATGFCKPYNGGYTFVALLPNEDVDINDYVSSLSGKHFMEMIEEAYTGSYTQVQCTLPKFTVEGSYELNDALKNMGIKDAFLQDSADFSKLVDNDTEFYIGRVFQKTYISVDENGTEAAAVTEVETGCLTTIEKSYEVNLNRPFIYAIVDNQKKLPIFIGTILDLEE